MRVISIISVCKIVQPNRTESIYRTVTGVIRLVFAALFLTFFGSAPSAAQLIPPINDNIEDAIHLRNNLKYFVGNNQNATMEVGEPGFENGERADKSVWYKYRADSDGFLVLISEGWTLFALGIEVFDGRSFDPVNRLASGSKESIGSFQLIRILIPVVQGQLVYVRVAGVFGSYAQEFSMHVLHTSSEGNLLVIQMQEPESPLVSPVIYGRTGSYYTSRNFRPSYMYVNTMLQAGNITHANFNLPAARVQRTSDRIPGRSSKKPGVQFAILLYDIPIPTVSGTWNYTYITKVRSGPISRRFAFRIPLMLWRSDEARISYALSTATVDAVLGNTARLLISVRNDSSFRATGCRILSFATGSYSQYSHPFEVRWRRQLPIGAMNGAIDIPARSTRTFEVFINTNFIGQYNGVQPSLACDNAPQTISYGMPRFDISSRP